MAVAVQAGQAGFDVQKRTGNVHQGAVVNSFGLHTESFDQFDLLGHHLARNAKAQYRQGVGNLAHTGQQLFQFIVLAELRSHKQVELVFQARQLFVQGAYHRMNGIPARAGDPGAGGVYVAVRGQGTVELIGLAQGLDLRKVKVPGAGDVIQQVLEQGLGHRLLQDGAVLVGEPADFNVDFPQQGFDRCVDRVGPGLEGINKGTGGFPEFAPRGSLAQTNQALKDLLHVVEVGCKAFLTHHSGQGKLVHLPQFAQVPQYFRVLQPLGNAGADLEPGGGQVRLEQRGVGQQRVAAGGAKVIQQWQQYHREIIPAAAQVLEVLRQLQDGLHQHFNGIVNAGDGFVQNGLGQLLHLFGEQGCTVEFHHLQGTVYLVQIVQAEAQASGVVAIFDVRFQCMLALGQRVLYFAPNPVEGDTVMVIAHNHSGYSSSDWRLIHASTCSEGTLCRPGGCQSVSSPWPSTSKPPGARRSASLLTMSRLRQRRK